MSFTPTINTHFPSSKKSSLIPPNTGLGCVKRSFLSKNVKGWSFPFNVFTAYNYVLRTKQPQNPKFPAEYCGHQVCLSSTVICFQRPAVLVLTSPCTQNMPIYISAMWTCGPLSPFIWKALVGEEHSPYTHIASGAIACI